MRVRPLTILELRPEKFPGLERNSNPRPLQYRCSALATELSKPHESGGLDSSFGRTLHRYRRGRGFESRFKRQVLVPVALRAALAFITILPN